MTDAKFEQPVELAMARVGGNIRHGAAAPGPSRNRDGLPCPRTGNPGRWLAFGADGPSSSVKRHRRRRYQGAIHTQITVDSQPYRQKEGFSGRH